jgi:hypothetical protein
VVVYQRVLPYMRNTFGEQSCLTLTFTYLGFPLGLLILDFLMLLEPFGLLAVLPLPAWLKQFVPACEQHAGVRPLTPEKAAHARAKGQPQQLGTSEARVCRQHATETARGVGAAAVPRPHVPQASR